MAVSWKKPKTNWIPSDRFNFSDYNRIKNNINYLYERAVKLSKYFEIDDMGSDITSYTAYFYADQFNIFEQNLDKIHEAFSLVEWDGAMTFYPNGTFIQYDELNRIESASLEMKNLADVIEAGFRKLSFKLGAYRDIRI